MSEERYWVEISFGDGGEMTVHTWPEDQTGPHEDYVRWHSWGGYVTATTAAASILRALPLAADGWNNLYGRRAHR